MRAVFALALLIAGNAAASWKSAEPRFAWEFPRDHWAHPDYRTEWWHFVGFAESAGGSRFAWQLTLFRSGLTLAPLPPSMWAARYGALGHLAVADLDSSKRVFSQTSHRESPALARFGTPPDPVIARVGGPPGTEAPWSVEFRDGGFALRAGDRDRGVSLDLTAVPTTRPLFHGEAGFSEKSAGGPGSNYYSQPRLRVEGRIMLDGEASEVTGSGWLDREFGSAWLLPDQTGWDWFALNHDDGRDLMLYLLRRRDGTVSYASGTIRSPGEGPRGLSMPEVRALGTWNSPAGGDRPYPSGWRVRLPGENLALRLLPELPDQENRRPRGQPGPDIPYWEGAVRVVDEATSEPFGRGFAELTGYRSDLVLGGLSADTIAAPREPEAGRNFTMMDGLTFIFRWLHIFVGILWIGHLYFFNFVNAQMVAKLDGRTKQMVVPELMPRALYWFRWGAAWTWITGALLVLLVFYHGGLMFDPGVGWGGGAFLMVAVTFLGVFLYDALWSSGLKSNVRAATIVSFLLLAAVVWLFVEVGNFTPRAVLIHTGAMFGTMMAFNVWFRIWPAQQRIIAAVKAGEAPAAADPALAGLRSKHNTYMSLPLLWAMANEHAFPFFGGNFGIPGDLYWVAWLAVVAISWHVIFQCYRIAGRLSGM